MKKITILGGGISGVGAAILAKKKGYEVFVSDANKIQNIFKTKLIANNINFEEYFHSENIILNSQKVIISPGVSSEQSIVKKIIKNNIPVVSEIEFAASYVSKPIIAITGSNGKTTTSSLIYHLLTSSKQKIALAGNIGVSFSEIILNGIYDYYVIEVSSFQLENIKNFKPKIAIILNISKDHLNRYNYDFNKYVQAKFNLISNMDAEDHFLYLENDANINNYLKHVHVKPCVYKINSQNKFNKNFFSSYIKGDKINFYFKNENLIVKTDMIPLKGFHNIINCMFAISTALILGVDKKKIVKKLKTFKPIKHRLEWVREYQGINFYNDSKATNVESAYSAINSFKNSVIWIAGGVDKGNDYSKIKKIAQKKIKALICLGIDNRKIIKEFKDLVNNVVQTNSMQSAVAEAIKLGKKNDVVLLSPACSSFDLFKNYEERGNLFKQELQKI